MSDFQKISGGFPRLLFGQSSVIHGPSLLGDGTTNVGEFNAQQGFFATGQLDVAGMYTRIPITATTYFPSVNNAGCKPGAIIKALSGGGIDLAIASSAANALAIGSGGVNGFSSIPTDSAVWTGNAFGTPWTDGPLYLPPGQVDGVSIPTQWQSITDEGTPLQPGKIYYLSDTTPGNITVTAPGIIVPVGIAISSTTLHFRIGYPILPS